MVNMLYRWRLFIVGTILSCLVGGLALSINSPVVNRSLSHRENTTVTGLKQLSYSKRQHLLYVSQNNVDQIKIFTENGEILPLKVVTQGHPASVFFLEGEEVHYVEIAAAKRLFVLLEELLVQQKDAHAFITAQGYFIGASGSYLCSPDLLLEFAGECHSTSYWTV
ncbi:MAG: hypothetical protein ACRC6X_00780 [Culicoidibacterales bacterium]